MMPPKSDRAWIPPRPVLSLLRSKLTDVSALEEVVFGVGRVRRDLVGDAVVSVEFRVVVVLQLAQAGGALVVPDSGVEVDQVRVTLALEDVQTDRQARAPYRRRVGDGGARKTLRLQVDKVTDEGVVVGADRWHIRLLGRRVSVDDGRVDARGPDSVDLQAGAEDVLHLLRGWVKAPVRQGHLHELDARAARQR